MSVLPIYKRNTVLYGKDGKYTLLKKNGKFITYIYQPYDDDSIYSKLILSDTMENLQKKFHFRFIWAVWDD